MGPAREVVTKSLIDRLYQTDVDILHAPGDGAPIIVPRRGRTPLPCANRPEPHQNRREAVLCLCLGAPPLTAAGW